MKKEVLTLAMLAISGFAVAQVGINIPDPKATFDIAAKTTGPASAEGLIAPRLRGDEIKGKDAQYTAAQTGAIIYATTAVTTPAGKTINITAPGYYYFDGLIWVRFISNNAKNGLSNDVDFVKLGGALTEPTIISTNAANNLVINATGIGDNNVEQNQGLNVLATAVNSASAKAIAVRGRISQSTGSIGQARGVSGAANITGGNIVGTATGAYFNSAIGGTTLPTNGIMTGVAADAETIGSNTNDSSNTFAGARFGANVASAPTTHSAGVVATAVGSSASNVGIAASTTTDAAILTGKVNALPAGTNVANYSYAPAGTSNFAIYSDGNVALKSLPTTGSTSLVGIDANGNLSTTAMAGATTADNGLTKTLDKIQLGGPLTKQTIIDTDAANNLVINATGIGGASSEANQGLNVLATATANSANAIALRGRVLQTAGAVGQLRGVTGVSTATGGTITGSSNGGYFNNQLSGGALATGALVSGVSGDVEATSGTANASNVMIGGRFGSVVSGTVNNGLAVGVLATASGSATANMGTLSIINDPTLANVGAASAAVGGAGNGAAVVAINPKAAANNFAIYSDGNVALKSLPTTGSNLLLGINSTTGLVSTTALPASATPGSGLQPGTAGAIDLGGTLTRQTTINTDVANNLVINATGIGDNNVEQNQGLNVLATAVNSASAKAIAVRGRVSQTTGSIGQVRGVSGAANITGGTIAGTATGGYFNTAISGATLPTSNGLMTGVAADAETIGANTNSASNTFAGARFGANVSSAPTTHSAGVIATAVGSAASNVGIAASTFTDAATLTGKVNALPAGTNVANYSYAPAGTTNFATYSDGKVAMQNLPTGIASSSFLVIDGTGEVKKIAGTAIIAAAGLDNTIDAWVNKTGRVELGTLANGTTARPAGTEVVATDAGNLGLGMIAPTNKLHVSATANPLRLEGLQTGEVTDLLLSSDATGVVRSISRTTITAGNGLNNVAVGSGAGSALTTGERNVFIGTDSGTLNTTGIRNTGIGMNSLPANTSGAENSGIGYSTLRFNTTGLRNTAVGGYSMLSNTSGTYNTAVGNQSLYANTIGGFNVALGNNALAGNTSGSYNIALGDNTAQNITTGSNNIVIGKGLHIQNAAASNQLNIGNLIYATGVDGSTTTLSSGNVGIGVKNPTAKLEINGKIKATNVNFSGLPTYADETAAISGGLTSGDMYKTATGDLKIKL